MGKLWPDEERKLIRSGRKWNECDYMPYRYAELYCECCGVSLGNHDIVCTNLQTNMFCGRCVQQYRREVPFQLAEDIDVVFDAGHYVEVKYTGRYYPEMTVAKECYFNGKGRFIKIKGKRHYLNYMPLPEPPEEDA